MPRIRKSYVVFIMLAIITAGVLVWVRSYVFENIAMNIQERLQSLTVSGFNVRYDSIRVDWRGNVIEIDHLLLEKNAYDTTCIYPEFISVQRVRAAGISLFQLIFRNVLAIDELHLDGARAVIREQSLMKLDSAAQRENEFTLRVGDLRMRSANIMYTDSAHCNTIAGVRSHLSFRQLNVDFHVDKPFAYEVESLTFDSVEIKLPARYYTFYARQAVWNFKKKAFRADSVNVIPDLGKMEFGKKYGYEVDRLECLIPTFAASGILLSLHDSLQMKIGLAEIRFQLKIFRDKRLPFDRKKKLLPVEHLRELPFQLTIDSMIVMNSFVQYEEFAEGTTEPGGIYFDELHAVLKNISNAAATGNFTLRSRARLFGEGDLTLYATFPFERNRRSSVAGSVRNFSLPKLNAILTPSTQLQVESGHMKQLLFNFTFNAIRSDGEIELEYENLKLVTFKNAGKTNKNAGKTNGDEPEKDNLKTFMMNTFVFRKNMTDDMPEDKRKGNVAYTRDNGRSIFNFWSKSLISGIKSAYNLDKSSPKKSAREIKKEERLSRREARKQRRAEKKRERG